MNILLYVFITLIFIGIPILTLRYFLSKNRCSENSRKLLWLGVILSLLSAVPVIFINIYNHSFFESHSSKNILVFLSALLVGINEEAFKTIPLGLIIYNKSYFKKYTDGIIYFFVAGAAFGIFENLSYTSRYGSILGVFHLIMMPMIHGSTASIFGYFLIKKKKENLSWFTPLSALLFLSFIHGLNNFGNGTENPLLTLISALPFLLLIPALFVLYKEARIKDEQTLLQSSEQEIYIDSKVRKKSILALFLGILGLIASFIPILGVVLGTLSIILGFRTIKSNRKEYSLIGIILGILTIILSCLLLAFNL